MLRQDVNVFTPVPWADERSDFARYPRFVEPPPDSPWSLSAFWIAYCSIAAVHTEEVPKKPLWTDFLSKAKQIVEAQNGKYEGFLQAITKVQGDTGEGAEYEIFLGQRHGGPVEAFVDKNTMLDKLGMRCKYIRLDVTSGSKPATRKLGSGYVPWPILAAAKSRRWWICNIDLDPKKDKEAKKAYPEKARVLYDNGHIDITFPKFINDQYRKFDKERRDLIEQLVCNCPHVEYAYISAGNCKVVIIEKDSKDKQGWLHLVQENLGIDVYDAKKTVKRLSQLDRPYLLFGKLDPSQVNFKLLTGNRKDLESFNDKEKESLLDGAIFASEDIRQLLIQTLKDQQNKRKDGGVSEYLLNLIEEAMQYNGRAFLPSGTKVGDRILEKGGQLKGQWFFSKQLPEKTICFHMTNIKEEMEVNKDQHIRICCDPQVGHDKSFMTIQYLVAQQHILPHDQVREWFVSNLEYRLEMVKAGQTEDDAHLWMLEQWGVLEPGYALSIRKKAYEWICNPGANGWQMPKLFEEACLYGMQNLVCMDEDWHISCKIPAAIHWQIISAATARSLGCPKEYIPKQGLSFWEERKLIIQDNINYIKNLPNHGGPDQDDLFDCIFRRVEETCGDVSVKAFLLRSPNDLGEYSVHEIHGNLPECINGSKLPVIKGDCKESRWPIQASVQEDMIDEKRVRLDKSKKVQRILYSVDTFKRHLREKEGKAGRLVNTCFSHRATSLASLGWNKSCEENWISPYSMEAAIDQSVQERNPLNIEILEAAADVVNESCKNYEKFCKVYWEKGQKFSYSEEEQVELEATKVVESELYLLFKFCKEKLDDTINKMKAIFKEEAPKHMLPAFKEFESISKDSGEAVRVLSVCNYWRQRKNTLQKNGNAKAHEEAMAAVDLKKAEENKWNERKSFFKFVYLTQFHPVYSDPSVSDKDYWKFNWLLTDCVWSAFMKECKNQKIWLFNEPGKQKVEVLSLKELPQRSSIKFNSTFKTPYSELVIFKTPEDLKDFSQEEVHKILNLKSQDSGFKDLLLSTGKADLIYLCSNQRWGRNAQGEGQNLLGRILMGLRTKLHEAQEGTQKAQEGL